MKKGLSVHLVAVATLLLLLSSSAFAGKFNAVVNGKSYHLNSSYQWNENNYGFGVEHEFTQKSAWRKIAMANGFRDSTDNMSYMAGAGLHRRIYETDELAGFYIYAGLNAFVMTREDVNGNKPFPGILPSISIGNDKVGLNLTYLPKKAVEKTTGSGMVDPTLSGILFLQFKVSMDQLLP
ncbi:MAG: hypothetical protein EX272_13240 [Chromatiales bacterium]|nr:MAG: hypothetical protein EX272_13240 [Chromatiales bacterium]